MQADAIIKAAIQSDQSMTSYQREQILAALKEPNPIIEQMLTRKEVASRLGVHVETVKRYDRIKLLKPVHLTKRAVRYPETQILDFMKNGGRA